MMTTPSQPKATPEAVDLDRKFREASRQPRGDWGDASFMIVDDEDEEATDDGR